MIRRRLQTFSGGSLRDGWCERMDPKGGKIRNKAYIGEDATVRRETTSEQRILMVWWRPGLVRRSLEVRRGEVKSRLDRPARRMPRRHATFNHVTLCSYLLRVTSASPHSG